MSAVPRSVPVLALLLVAALLPLGVRDDWLSVLAAGLVLAIGAVGLNVLLGYAGRISLGHAFFVGVGAYTAAVVSGDPEGRVWGWGLTNPLVWIPAAALVAGLVGVLLAPWMSRLDGLYLAVATLGLVVVGEWAFAEVRSLSGGPLVGRDAARPVLLGLDLTRDGRFTEEQLLYWLDLAVLVVVLVVVARLVRSRTGRALAAVRDREVAARTMGIAVARHQRIAFAVAAAAAGTAGSLAFVAAGHVGPERFALALSVQAVAAVLVGGAGTLAGPVVGALVIALLPRLAAELPRALPVVSASPLAHPNVYDVELLLYGLLLLVVVLYQPRGLRGLGSRLRRGPTA